MTRSTRPARSDRLRRTTAALAVPALLALGVSACGSQDSPRAGDPATAVAGSDLAPGAAVGATDLADLLQRAFADASTAQIHLTATAAMLGQFEATGAARFDPADPAFAMTTSGGSGMMSGIAVRLLDQKVYLKLPTMMLGAFGGGQETKPWLVLDLADPKGPLADLGSMADGFDPRTMLQALQKAYVSGTYEGQETAAGRPAAHYRFTVDTAKLLGALAEGARSGGPALDPGAAKGLPATSTADLYLDADGHLAAVAAAIPTPGAGGSAGGSASDPGSEGSGSLRIEFRDWGAPVDITAPPADQVTDASAMLQHLQGLLGSTGKPGRMGRLAG